MTVRQGNTVLLLHFDFRKTFASLSITILLSSFFEETTHRKIPLQSTTPTHIFSLTMLNSAIYKVSSFLLLSTICNSILFVSSSTPTLASSSTSSSDAVEYGVDVSFPIQHNGVSKNYAWLKHNVDPKVQTPREYKDMVVQPLGNRQQFYDDFLTSCEKAFGARGDRCKQNEFDRIQMSLRQPQSMQV